MLTQNWGIIPDWGSSIRETRNRKNHPSQRNWRLEI